MATPKPKRSPEEVEDIILRKIFLVSLAGDTAADSDSRVVYLEMTAAEILSERKELRLSRDFQAFQGFSLFCGGRVARNPGEMYRPRVEVSRSWCRQLKKGIQKSDSLRYYLSFMQSDNEGSQGVQMDTESAVLYNKTCLDYNFQKPVQVTGDVRVTFYHKINGGRLFYACFNTAFTKNSVLQLTVKELDKIGGKGRSIRGPAFCLELLFGPANVKHSFSTSPSSDFNDDGDSSSDWSGNL